MRRGAALSALLALVAITAQPPARVGALASPVLPMPLNLRVSGGEQSWHADNAFRLDWDRSPDLPVLASVAYTVRDSEGHVVGGASGISARLSVIEPIHVPAAPGLYRAEVWYELPGGERGAAASAALRFDDVAPAPAAPVGPSGWVAAGSAATIRIEHPASPLPVSGIGGYAISVDRGDESAPCAGPARCTLAETDLPGGIDDDTIALRFLPEGANFARVVAVSGSGMRSRVVGSTEVLVDASVPEVALEGVPSGWADRSVHLTATASDRLSGMVPSGSAGPFTAIAVDEGAAATAPGSSVSVTVHGDGAHQVAFYARDAAGNVADGQADSPAPSLAIVRIDETPPRLAFANVQDPSDPERIEASVEDTLSGPDRSGGTIAMRPAGSGRPFERLSTATIAGRLVARWDSDSYPPGRYEFRASANDLAGNAAESGHRADGAPMVLANPLKRATRVESGFGPRRARRRRTVAYGRRSWFGGRLTSAGGAPLEGLPVTIVETFEAGAALDRRTTVVKTDQDGAFRAELLPGPSRRVDAVFEGNGLLRKAGGPQLQLDVRSSVRLHTSASTARIGGAPVLFSGTVGQLGTRVSSGGRPVQLQFRLPGSPWSEFRTVQSNAAGRFRLAYSFSDDDSRGVRFQFRAYLPAQEGWPYRPAASFPVAVTGR